MEAQNENKINDYPDVISYDSTLEIIEQMKKMICRINIEKDQGTGFFCKIPFPDKNNMLPVLITNNHIINQNILDKQNMKISVYIKESNDKRHIILNDRMKYTNKDYDITIIEIKEKDNINNYLELDDIIMNDIINNKNSNIEYEYESLYIIQYPNGKLSVSYGILQNIFEDKKYNFQHKCSTYKGSSGSPILNTKNKIIGIHKKGYNRYNIGTFLNEPIKEFIQQNYKVNQLIKFNEKYKSNIKDININKIDLNSKNIGNEGLKCLCQIEFKKLKSLNLCKNDISDIKILQKAKFDKLEYLDLSTNKISDINILEKINFNELKELNLSKNNITNIKVLEKAKFDKLEYLDLSTNKISNINILEKINFKALKKLDLNENNITDLGVLKKLKYLKPESIHLAQDKISEINNKDINKNKTNMNMMQNMNMITSMNMNLFNYPNQYAFQTSSEITLTRLKKEFDLCSKDNDLIHIGCTFCLIDNNIYNWKVNMIGPGNTPYENGLFTIKIIFPPDYPNHGPEFKFMNKIYHLNVDLRDNIGHISLSRINEWATKGKVTGYDYYVVKNALFDIFCLFYNQAVDNSYDEEMGDLYRNNRDKFNEIAREYTKKYAITF